jgi:hypothetical protein
LFEYLSGPGKTFTGDVVFMNTTAGKRISVGQLDLVTLNCNMSSRHVWEKERGSEK